MIHHDTMINTIEAGDNPYNWEADALIQHPLKTENLFSILSVLEIGQLQITSITCTNF